MRNFLKLQFLISLCFFLATLGCGSKDTTQEAAPAQAAPATVSEAKKVEPAVPVEQPKPESVAITVEGVPDLDPSIGPTLNDVAREESTQFNKDAMAQYKKKNYGDAIGLFIKSLEKNPSNLLHRFNLACSYSLNGNKDKTLGILRQFKETKDCPRCFIMLAQATKDKDFDSIREDAEYMKLVEGAPQRLNAELGVAKWLQFNGSDEILPVSTNDLPAISSDGKRVAVTQYSNGAYRLEIIYVSTGKVIGSSVILNQKEVGKLEAGDMSAADAKPAVTKRVKKAHKMLLGREWVEFKIQAEGIDDEGWLEGNTAQDFKLGNSMIHFDAPKLIVKNSKGRESFNGNVPTTGDDCTQYTLITQAYVIGKFHTMLFDLSNFTTGACTPEPGKYFVLKLE